jgi:hypothetical protein
MQLFEVPQEANQEKRNPTGVLHLDVTAMAKHERRECECYAWYKAQKAGASQLAGEQKGAEARKQDSREKRDVVEKDRVFCNGIEWEEKNAWCYQIFGECQCIIIGVEDIGLEYLQGFAKEGMQVPVK